MTFPIGETAALITAAFWAVTASAFEDAGKKIGTHNVNIIRLFMGLIFLSLFTLLIRGKLLPLDGSWYTWKWLLLSGLIGLMIGDLLLFEAFVMIGARISMLIYASVPPLSGLIAFLVLGERMTPMEIGGMVLTLSGIGLVILKSGGPGRRIRFSHPVLGILFAFGGALGQASGYVVGKLGMADYDPFAATQIRLIGAIAGFLLFFTITRRWKGLIPILKQPRNLKSTAVGSFFGPFLGVSLSLFAVQRVNPGVASTLMSVTPVLLILYAIIFKKEKVHPREILGALVAFSGLVLMFI